MPAAVDVPDAPVLGLLILAYSPRRRLSVSDVFLLDLRIYLILAARAHPRHVVLQLVVVRPVAHDRDLCLSRHLVVALHSHH